MKYIVFSFDDGRKDTFEVASNILSKHNFTASIHVITGYVDGTVNPDSELLAKRGFITIKNCIELSSKGFDISSHSNSHINDVEDIKSSFDKLVHWGLYNSQDSIGFSSPRSLIDNKTAIFLKENQCAYIRSGTRLRERSFISKILFFFSYYLKSKKCFYLFNKNYLIEDIKKIPLLIPSVAIKSKQSISSIMYMIQKMPDNSVVVLNFHSIVDGKIKNTWDFSKEKFNNLCAQIKQNSDIKVVNLKQLKDF